MELKNVVKQIPEIEAVSSSLGGLDTHSDIKQIKSLQTNLKTDENRKDLAR